MRERQKQRMATGKDRDRFVSTSDRTLCETVAVLERLDRGVPLREAMPQGERSALLFSALMNVLRHRAVIDWILDSIAARKIRSRLRRVLRWGAAQVLYGESLPAAVATDACVRFVKRRYAAHEAHFVNAVLRRLTESDPEHVLHEGLSAAPVHVRLELGEALYRQWQRRFSDEQLASVSSLILEPASVTVRLRAGASEPGSGSLRPLGPFPWAPEQRFWVCEEPAEFFASPAHHRGDFYIQDPSTSAAAALLDARPGECVADLCAAPGGKALMLGEQLACRGTLICLERSARRLQRMLENLGGLEGCHVALGDAVKPPFADGTFDAILLDVPCSNTGVVRRRPDVRWHFSRQRLEAITQLQREILAGTAPLLKPGGRLVYSTCSIEPEENRQQVERFLADRDDFGLSNEIALMPMREHDGAYAALLCRRS